MANKWKFCPNQFNGNGEGHQLGSIEMPNGLWFCAVEHSLDFGLKSDIDIINDVVTALNREMPRGKLRKHSRKKGKN